MFATFADDDTDLAPIERHSCWKCRKPLHSPAWLLCAACDKETSLLLGIMDWMPSWSQHNGDHRTLETGWMVR